MLTLLGNRGGSDCDGCGLKALAVATRERSAVRLAVVIAAGLATCPIQGLQAQNAEGQWKVFPSCENARAAIKNYAPDLNKHFKFQEGVLTASSFLGEEFYAKNGVPKKSFSGVGHIWVTNAAWPNDLADFDLTLDYRCETTDRFSDSPDLHIGFRLNPQGEGYYLSWGMLGNVQWARTAKEGWCNIGRGAQIRVGPGWHTIRLRAAGPILKGKVWQSNQPEPANWSVESLDDWQGTNETRFQRGVLTLGFYGRQLFDHTHHHFKNVRIKPIAAEEKAKEVFFDAQTAPNQAPRGVKALEQQKVDILFSNEAAIKGFSRDANLGPVRFTAEGMVLNSTDGKPAFLWTAVQRGSLVVAQAKAENGARPLLAVRPLREGQPQAIGCLDPVWRTGVMAFALAGPRHLCGAGRFEWKGGTWHGLGWARQHLMSCEVWQIDNPQLRAECVFKPENMEFDRQVSKLIGLGVAGQGPATFKGISSGR